MSFNIEICKMNKETKKPECTRIKFRRSLIAMILVGMGIAALINFLIGLALYDPLEYLALSLILSLIVIGCIIPIFGLVVLIGYYTPWTSAVIADLGVAPSVWLDALLTITWWLGLVVQIVILILLVYHAIAIASGKEMKGWHPMR